WTWGGAPASSGRSKSRGRGWCGRSARPTRRGSIPVRVMTPRGRYALSIFFALPLTALGGAFVPSALAQAPARPAAPTEIIVKELRVQANRRLQETVLLGRQ